MRGTREVCADSQIVVTHILSMAYFVISFETNLVKQHTGVTIRNYF